MTATRLEVPAPSAEISLAFERSLLFALAAFRWAAFAWLAVVATIDLRNGPVAHPAAMVALVGLALAVTVVDTVAVRLDPAWLLRSTVIAVELLVGASLVFADHWVYGPDSAHSQSLGSVWPLAGVLTAGIRGGGLAGLAVGAALGVAAWAGDLVFVPGRWNGDRTLAAVGSIVLFGLAGSAAGLTAGRLRQAERHVAWARAREDVARTLHDGVLQTLAVVQRRSDDGELVALARDQELELRTFLFGTAPTGDGRGTPELLTGVRQAAALAERRHGVRVEVASTPDVPAVAPVVAAAVIGAVAELLTNAAKHGHAQRATVFVDQASDDDHLVCSVTDDGAGFDPATTGEGSGLRSSVRGRIEEIGGTVHLRSRLGHGTTIELEVPCQSPQPTSTAGGR